MEKNDPLGLAVVRLVLLLDEERGQRTKETAAHAEERKSLREDYRKHLDAKEEWGDELLGRALDAESDLRLWKRFAKKVEALVPPRKRSAIPPRPGKGE